MPLDCTEDMIRYYIRSHHQKQTVPVARLATVEMLWHFLRLHQRSIELLQRVFQAGPI
jgi:hypothetical protein